eukprot:SAG31_NODE_1594_length_7791_cov_2.912192_1_plen_154_part_00
MWQAAFMDNLADLEAALAAGADPNDVDPNSRYTILQVKRAFICGLGHLHGPHDLLLCTRNRQQFTEARLDGMLSFAFEIYCSGQNIIFSSTPSLQLLDSCLCRIEDVLATIAFLWPLSDGSGLQMLSTSQLAPRPHVLCSRPGPIPTCARTSL